MLFKPITLGNFFLSEEIFFDLSGNIEFLIKCYLLTIYKEPFHNFNSRINFPNLQQKLNISKYGAIEFIRHLQVSLSELSINYIQSIADEHEIVLKKLIAHDLAGRTILPCYFLTTLIFKKLKELQSDILVLIRETKKSSKTLIYSLYSPIIPKNNSYQFQNQSLITDHPYFVLNCYSDNLFSVDIAQYQQKIAKIGVENLFLYCTANHAQYSPTSLSQLNKDTYSDLLDDPDLSNKEELASYAHRLLTRYETDKINYMNTLLNGLNQHLCEIEHISMGTLESHNIVYQDLHLGKLSSDLIEEAVNE